MRRESLAMFSLHFLHEARPLLAYSALYSLSSWESAMFLPQWSRGVSHELTLPGNFSPARRRRAAAQSERTAGLETERRGALEPACCYMTKSDGAARRGGLTLLQILYQLWFKLEAATQPKQKDWLLAYNWNIIESLGLLSYPFLHQKPRVTRISKFSCSLWKQE